MYPNALIKNEKTEAQFHLNHTASYNKVKPSTNSPNSSVGNMEHPKVTFNFPIRSYC